MTQGFVWPEGFQGAVSLTYDDGLPVHYEQAAPLLNQYNLLATFYVPIQSDLIQHPERWRGLAEAGHELGNHSVFHPCRQVSPDPYPWLDQRYDMGSYTPAHMRAELEVANLALRLLDDQTSRSYACTCGDLTIGRGELETPLRPIMAELFTAARGEITNRVVQPGKDLDLFNIGCIRADSRSLEELKDITVMARTSGGWAVLVFHGIGAGTHDLYTDSEVHNQFIEWLYRQQALWTAPVRTIAQFIQQ